MYNLFEPTTAAEIVSRIEKLQSTSQARWGKMSVSQMLAHCNGPLETYFDETKAKRNLMGLLFGKIEFKQLISEKPWRKGLPTAREFKITGSKNFEEEKIKLLSSINRFSTEGCSITFIVHPFFGKLSAQEYALFNYRHLDHHLHQFGV